MGLQGNEHYFAYGQGTSESSIYFPQFAPKVDQMALLSSSHTAWIATAANKKLQGDKEYSNDILVTYGPYNDHVASLVRDIGRYAQREFAAEA